MKTKKLLTIFGITILILGLVMAGGALLNTNSNLSIDPTKEQTLKDSISKTMVRNIIINAGEIACDDKDCWASISSSGLMNTEFRTSKNYCDKYNETSCTKYLDYTSIELVSMRDEWIKNRLENYADVIKSRTDNITKTTSIAGEGAITVNKNDT